MFEVVVQDDFGMYRFRIWANNLVEACLKAAKYADNELCVEEYSMEMTRC